MLAWALITAAKERWGFDLGWILAGSEGPADWEDSEEKIEDATDEGYWEQQTDSSEDDRATGVDTEGTTTGSEVEWFECENEDDTPFVHKSPRRSTTAKSESNAIDLLIDDRIFLAILKYLPAGSYLPLLLLSRSVTAHILPHIYYSPPISLESFSRLFASQHLRFVNQLDLFPPASTELLLGDVASLLSKTPMLTHLRIESSPWISNIFARILNTSTPHLTHLSITRTASITPTFFTTLALPHLSELTVADCPSLPSTETLHAILRHHQNLTHLRLECLASDTAPVLVRETPRHDKLTHLHLPGMGVRPEQIPDIPTMTHLSVERNPYITSSELAALLERLKNLVIVDARGTRAERGSVRAGVTVFYGSPGERGRRSRAFSI